MMFYRHMNNTKLLAQQSLPKKSTDRSEDDDSETDSVFTDQLQDLRQRLTNAMTTADELRRRLAMVSRYYEGALGKMEQDMFRKLSLLSTDKDKAMAQLQRRVRDLEDEQVRTQELQLVAQTIDWKSNHS
jgi:prefoldin subunit 5